MVALLVVSLVTGAQIWYVRSRNKTSWLEITVAAITGLLLGSALDYLLGFRMGLWSYTRHPYWDIDYWTVLPAMWAEFGVGVWILWNTLKPRIRLLTVPALLIPYELYGVIRNSWTYNVPWWIVALGWFPLIFTIIICISLCVKVINEQRNAGQILNTGRPGQTV